MGFSCTRNMAPLFLEDRSICFRALKASLGGTVGVGEVAASLARAKSTSRSLGALEEFLVNRAPTYHQHGHVFDRVDKMC